MISGRSRNGCIVTAGKYDPGYFGVSALPRATILRILTRLLMWASER